jgi:ABC-type uncharacterized transport system auxiliary subunit
MKTRIQICVVVLALGLLNACSGVLTSEQPAKQYYALMPLAAPPGGTDQGPGPALSILVSAVPGLDTDRVLALGPDASLNRYANARWPDHLPEVLTSVMRRSLVNSGRFSVVEEAGHGKGEWVLKLEVQQFYGIQDQAGNTSSVLVEMSGTVYCDGSLNNLKLSDSNRVTEERLAAVVSAHQTGLDHITEQLIDQLTGACTG